MKIKIFNSECIRIKYVNQSCCYHKGFGNMDYIISVFYEEEKK